MGFLRSKSKTRTDESEPPRRNRLSKPLTSRSQTNLRAPSRQDDAIQNGSAGISQPSSTESLAKPLETESFIGLKYSSVSEENKSMETLTARNSPVKPGVAQLVARFESSQPGPNISQQFINKTRGSAQSSRPVHVQKTFAKQYTPNGHINSAEQLAAFRNSGAYRISPSESLDQLVDPFAIPIRRPSKYRPGEATRQPQSQQTNVPMMEKPGDAEADRDDDALSFINGADTIPKVVLDPSQPGRTGSPNNLDHLALGNLSLGSLCVTNGRASPAISEIPKHIQTRRVTMPSRQVSSNYAASEAWEDETVKDDADDIRSVSRYASTNYGRDFSYIAGAEARMMPPNQPTIFQQVTVPPPPKTPASKSRNQNAVSAEEYMAELPASPFAELESSSSGTSIRSTGSVIRHDVAEQVDDGSLTDESIMYSSPVGKREVSGESKASAANSNPSMVESKLSSVDSQFVRDEVYQSALEFQSIPPRSPDRTRPSTSQEAAVSDSGYGSRNSLAMVATDMSRFEKLRPSVTTEEVHPAYRVENTPKKLGGFLPLRPVLKSRATAPTVPVLTTPEPTTVNRISMEKATKSPMKSEKSPSQPSKFRNKLRKSRPNSFVGLFKPPTEIVVQRNVSEEVFDVPAISATATANLGLRHQALPDLDRVVRNHNYSANASTTSLIQEIRFPSPNPESDERTSRQKKSRDRSRSRSKSRRRSFLSIFRGDKDNEKRLSGSNQRDTELTIDDLGDVVASLGSNPYDIATSSMRGRNAESHQPRSGELTPSNLSMIRPSRPSSMIEDHNVKDSFSNVYKTTHESDGLSQRQRSRPRSMMDDKTATEFARSRSRSIHKRDSWNERRISINDRPGLPGRTLRASSAADDAPPVPPIPHHDSLRPISWCYSQSPTSVRANTPRSEEPSWISDAQPELEERPPPPPPSHSPHPSFLHDNDHYFQHGDENLNHHEEDSFTHYEEEDPIAPPPPSHSPRPMDIVSELEEPGEDQWAAQARAWKARRQSAGERLKGRWSTNVDHHHDPYAYQNNAVFEDDELYPEIPPKPREYYEDVDTRYQYPEQRHDWGCQPEYEHNPIYRAQTWDETNQRSSYGHHVTPDYNCDVPEEWPSHSPQHQNQHYHHQHNKQHIQTQQYARNQHHQPYHNRSREPSPNPNPGSNPASNPNTSRQLPLPSSRPHSRHSAHSFASSLAEELHPPDLHERRSPAPEFSRYSGGLNYGYEGRDKGFSGSAGTRNVSARANGAGWKSLEMRRSWGVDLGDVPVIGVAVRV